MKIGDSTAFRLQLHSKVLWSVVNKASIANEQAHLVILDVPCEVSFGFSSKKRSGPFETNACALIFGSSGNDLFGAFYMPVDEDSNAPSILNLTIAHAIEQTKDNPKFKAAIRSVTIEPSPKRCLEKTSRSCKMMRNLWVVRSCGRRGSTAGGTHVWNQRGICRAASELGQVGGTECVNGVLPAYRFRQDRTAGCHMINGGRRRTRPDKPSEFLF